MWMPQPSRIVVRPTSALTMFSYLIDRRNNGIGPKLIDMLWNTYVLVPNLDFVETVSAFER